MSCGLRRWHGGARIAEATSGSKVSARPNGQARRSRHALPEATQNNTHSPRRVWFGHAPKARDLERLRARFSTSCPKPRSTTATASHVRAERKAVCRPCGLHDHVSDFPPELRPAFLRSRHRPGNKGTPRNDDVWAADRSVPERVFPRHEARGVTACAGSGTCRSSLNHLGGQCSARGLGQHRAG